MNDTLFMHVYSRTVLLVEEKGKSWEADARLSRRRINESWHGTHRGSDHTCGRVKITRSEARVDCMAHTFVDDAGPSR